MTPDEFGLRLANDCGVAPGAHVLAAVSGGADSVALLCFLSEVRQKYPLVLSCAHVEHGIRGEASLGDAAFVRALCARLGVEYHEGRADVPGYAREHRCGIEEAARTLRYDFLHQTAARIGADHIALAHHAQDQAETVLLHALRGSDMRGLCAMRARRGRLIRPLLGAWPGELRDYLAAIGQPWREDESNARPDNARNIIRLLAMPQLEAACPGAAGALLRLAAAAQRDEAHFAHALRAQGIRLLRLTDGAAAERDALCALDDALLTRALAALLAQAQAEAGSAAIERVARLVRQGQGAVSLPGADARLGRRYLCVTRRGAPCPDTTLRAPGETDTPFGRFNVREAMPGETGDGRAAQAIPARLLAGARVTRRRAGDAMTPFGMRAAKKLKDVLTDAGVERAMKDSVPILRDGEGILWAVGVRPDERVRARAGEPCLLVRYEGPAPCEGWDARPCT